MRVVGVSSSLVSHVTKHRVLPPDSRQAESTALLGRSELSMRSISWSSNWMAVFTGYNSIERTVEAFKMTGTIPLLQLDPWSPETDAWTIG